MSSSWKKLHLDFLSGPALVAYLSLIKLLLHLLTAARYGIFRDELYYLACGEHLAWGYVDQPPLIALAACVTRHLLGESLFAIRLLPALAGALLVWVAGTLARELGGGRTAQALAALGVLVAPIYLATHHILTMNAFEPLFWMGCIWCVLRVIHTGQSHYLLWAGVLVGLGMENKYAMAFVAAALLLGVLLTKERHILATRWTVWAVLAAGALFLPNLLWLWQHHFPFLELMHNVRQSGRDVARSPFSFLLDQALILNPLSFLLWGGGVVWLLFNRANGHCHRALAWTYLLLLTWFILTHGKNYYLAPIYPMLLAAGAVGLEQFFQNRARLRWFPAAYAALILVASAVLAPLEVPMLPVETFIRYQRILGAENVGQFEHQNNGPLPQLYADEFGWEEMARETARVYAQLSPEEKTRTTIFANDYGEAGAIDFFGPRYGLPRALCNHQNYWFWGPGAASPQTYIVLGSNGKGDRAHFASVEAVGRVTHPYSRRDEHFDIFLCRGPQFDLQKLWPSLKKWN